jgi:flavin-binding protein dodecin
MSTIVKVIEVIGQSNESFDDAVKHAVAETAKSVSGIKTVWVDNLSAVVEDRDITEFRANVKISFLVQGRT